MVLLSILTETQFLPSIHHEDSASDMQISKLVKSIRFDLNDVQKLDFAIETPWLDGFRALTRLEWETINLSDGNQLSIQNRVGYLAKIRILDDAPVGAYTLNINNVNMATSSRSFDIGEIAQRKMQREFITAINHHAAATKGPCMCGDCPVEEENMAITVNHALRSQQCIDLSGIYNMYFSCPPCTRKAICNTPFRVELTFVEPDADGSYTKVIQTIRPNEVEVGLSFPVHYITIVCDDNKGDVVLSMGGTTMLTFAASKEAQVITFVKNNHKGVSDAYLTGLGLDTLNFSRLEPLRAWTSSGCGIKVTSCFVQTEYISSAGKTSRFSR